MIAWHRGRGQTSPSAREWQALPVVGAATRGRRLTWHVRALWFVSGIIVATIWRAL